MTAWFLGAWVLVAAGVAVAAACAGQWLLALAGHLLSGLLGARVAQQARGPLHGPPTFEYTLALAVPGLGGLMACLMALGARAARPGTAARDYQDYIDAAQRGGIAHWAGVARHALPMPDDVEPLADVLASSAAAEDKRNAIKALARLETPAAVATLRAVLKRGAPEIRFYAASVLARLEERLAFRLQALQAEAAAAPDARRPALDLDLARAYFDYVYFGLVSETHQRDYLEHAVRHARRAWQEGGHAAALLLAGRGLIQLGAFAEADDLFSQYLAQAGQDLKGYLWRAEARFLRGDFAGLRADCRQALRMGPVPERVAPALQMWN